ncbi:unnamed protein product, partial [Didymodactylos carnosus]
IIMHLRLVLLVAFLASLTIAERARNDRHSAINDDDDDDDNIDAQQEFSEREEDNEDVKEDEDEQEVVDALKRAGVMTAFYNSPYRWATARTTTRKKNPLDSLFTEKPTSRTNKKTPIYFRLSTFRRRSDIESSEEYEQAIDESEQSQEEDEREQLQEEDERESKDDLRRELAQKLVEKILSPEE